uniref:VWFA domain-containing protein n=1 Tax=Oryzias melastigma TaxID=30732 RepID=A0A3B3D5Z4_ORYME
MYIFALLSLNHIFSECTKNKVDLVFLFDGSGSMTEEEFKKNKDFIKSIMDSLSNTTIKFAAVQFSRRPRIVFDFNDHVAGRALEKLMKEKHMKSLTNTYRALQLILDNLFGKESAGATPGATQVLVLITDGDPSDTQKDVVLTKYDQKNIIRFVIGVRINSMEKIKPIASEPKDKHVFKIEDYKGLDGILKTLKNKIIILEGMFVFFLRFYTFSTKPKSWRGSLKEPDLQHEKQILDPDMEMDSYMGFSLSTGERNGVPLYFSGAPRFQHTGQVVIFTRTGRHWTVQQRLEGTKVGSYFGAEICTVDIDSDDSTDFLLVGAPMFYQPLQKTEGKVYVYALTNKMQLEMRLSLTAPFMGRFGTTISSLADLNGDGLRDVAVGAPLEDDNHGAVYIYLGDRNSGMRHTFSQRISGKSFQPAMKLFGLAIDGDGDLGHDGLPDIVVGSQEAAVVLRSKPVYNVEAHLSFHPEVISIDEIDCVSSDHEVLPMVNLTTCFNLKEATGRRTKLINGSFFFKLSVLMFFGTCCVHLQKKVLTSTITSPHKRRLNFSQPDNENAIAVLNTDSKKEAIFEVRTLTNKRCKRNNTCIAELDVDFNFMTPKLLVSEQSYFNVSMLLVNNGDDSYNTSLTVLHSPGLSFSSISVTKVIQTLSEEGDGIQCGISHPVYRSGSSVSPNIWQEMNCATIPETSQTWQLISLISSLVSIKATFHLSFHVIKDIDWNDTMTMTVFGQRYAYDLISLKEDSVTYLNFTTENNKPKKMVITYQVRHNTGFKDFPVNVSLYFPKQVQENFELINYQIKLLKNGQVTENDQTAKWVRRKHPNGHREYREQLFTTCILCPKQSEVRVEIIVLPNQWLIIGTGAGAGLLLLIIIKLILCKVRFSSRIFQ